LNEYAYRLNFVHRYIAETLNHRLEAAQVFKTRMVSLVAHDLRNPLSSIILGSKLALRHVATDHEIVESTLQDILTLCHDMNSLIDDILDTTALESGVLRLQKEHLNATHLVQTTCGRYQAMAAAKQQWLETQLEEECLVYADVSKLQQVIENLLSNAIKYSPLGKPISVRLLKHSVKVRLFVQDQGSGLTEEDKKHIFGLFVKLSARPTGNESSNGVGLSNVKHLIELHDGTVSVESRADEGIPGATFIVELPAAAYEMVS
jgi:signal transduction histidine kinase